MIVVCKENTAVNKDRERGKGRERTEHWSLRKPIEKFLFKNFLDVVVFGNESLDWSHPVLTSSFLGN